MVLSGEGLIWAVGSLCGLHRLPFSKALLAREFPPPHDRTSLIKGLRACGLEAASQPLGPLLAAGARPGLSLPLLVLLKPQPPATPAEGPTLAPSESIVGQEQVAEPALSPALVLREVQDAEGQTTLVLVCPGQPGEMRFSREQLLAQAQSEAFLTRPAQAAPQDPDAQAALGLATPSGGRSFGFAWFVPELLRHKKVWRDVLLASAVLQLISLATPLFTQAIIDKVVVHRTQSTLIAIAVVMAVFILFTALLTWVRQYLVLHTGNRVDAVLGAAVWQHLLKLPLRYFEHRSTGVVAARLHGVETIREFVASAAVTLVLDLPFLVLCLIVMLYYSLTLSAIAIAILTAIALASAMIAPLFQQRLNEQFLMGARNQAFITEHIAGFETVKSLQMEPQLNRRYGDYLAAYLHKGFETRQIANSYNTFANTAEQVMTLSILMVGAWVVMTEPSFTIGMLIAFQMFAGKLSQPVLRIVGLWTQFQQARLAVQRLGDVMNVPTEAYSLQPQRQEAGARAGGQIEIKSLGFRYQAEGPLLLSNVNLSLSPGQAIAVMGASGTGKSTLAKILLGFYPPTEGQVLMDGIDIRHLSANELRAYFGVVPQETILFTGTVLDNLMHGNPYASFEQVMVAARLAGIHEAIEKLPQGYATMLGERGVGLSGGQKQRLAIARALLKQPKVLIFDEATSALDKDTAEGFAQTVNQLKGKVSMIFITHGLPRNLKIDGVLTINQSGGHEFRLLNKATETGKSSPSKTGNA